MWSSGEGLGLGYVFGNPSHTGNIYSQETGISRRSTMMKKEQKQAGNPSIKEDRASKED